MPPSSCWKNYRNDSGLPSKNEEAREKTIWGKTIKKPLMVLPQIFLILQTRGTTRTHYVKLKNDFF
jgi:hypothetical protein